MPIFVIVQFLSLLIHLIGKEDVLSQFEKIDFLIDMDDVVPKKTKSSLLFSYWAKIFYDKPVYAKNLVVVLRKDLNNCEKFNYNNLENEVFLFHFSNGVDVKFVEDNNL